MIWSEEELEKLPKKQGFRLRGLEMTRLETFIDAAFAFAITILVISIGELPKNYGELVNALKDAPAFAGVMPTKIGIFAGFIYFFLPIAMPITAIHYYKKAEKIDKAALTDNSNKW